MRSHKSMFFIYSSTFCCNNIEVLSTYIDSDYANNFEIISRKYLKHQKNILIFGVKHQKNSLSFG